MTTKTEKKKCSGKCLNCCKRKAKQGVTETKQSGSLLINIKTI